MLLSLLLPSISHRSPNFIQSSPLLLSHFKTLLNLHTCPSPSPNPNPNPNPNPLFPSSHFPQNPHNPSSDFDPKTVQEAISTYSNDWKRALDFFNWVESEHRFQHTPHTYNRTIDVLGKFFEFDLAWSLIARMRKSPLSQPDHATFRIIFKRLEFNEYYDAIKIESGKLDFAMLRINIQAKAIFQRKLSLFSQVF